MRPNMKTIVLAGAVALAVAIPASAEAATITYEGETLVYRGAPGEKNSTGPSAGLFDTSLLRFSDQVPIAAPADRCQTYDGWVECARPSKVVIDMGDGDDYVSFTFSVPGIVYEVYGGDGDDWFEAHSLDAPNQPQLLDGGAGNDRIDGDQGDDVVRGGPGNDELDGGAGNDRLEGGDGNDTLFGDHYDKPGTDSIDGGAGFDKVDDYIIPGDDFNPRVAISFDGVANDGRPGENDNLVGVEKLDSSAAGSFTGSAGDDDFFVMADDAPGSSTITGAAGNDRLTGHDQEETIDGGPGNDRVEGGYNNDTLTGGPGRDTIFGDSTTDTCNFLSCKIPFGNDVIDARDGEQDTIDCGFGEDRATVDAIDVVANCEQVEKGGGPAPGPGGGGGGKLDAPQRYTRKQLRKGIAVAWDCAAACTVKVTLTADKKTATTLRTKLIAAGKGSIARAGTVKFRAKLTKKARKRIGRLRKGHATLAMAVKQGGATQRHAQAVTLKR
jgi:RTX calcium-binding nonapeptide repeat (4 copies)